MNTAKMMEWIRSHNVGISSKTMWNALMNVSYDRNDHPYDVDDFSRCYDLYTFCELNTPDLHKIATVYPYWQPIVERWEELCEMYKNKDYNALYETINSMRDRIMEIKGFTKIREGSYIKKRIP